MESPNNPFRKISGSTGICLQSGSIVAYRLTDSAPWILWTKESDLVDKAGDLMQIPLWTALYGVDAEAFVCLCIDLWEETHK